MTTLTDTEYRRMLLAHARRTWPRMSPEDHDDLVQETYLKVCAAYPDKERFLHRNLYLLTMQRIVMDWEREAKSLSNGGSTTTVSLNVPAQAGGDPYEAYLPAHHDTAKEAITNLSLAGIFERLDSPGVRAIVGIACGHSWEEVEKSEGLAHFSMYRRMKAARRELKEMGYA